MRRLLAPLCVAAGCLLPLGASAASLEVELAFVGASGAYPPDTMGAVGPDHVVEITNGGFAVHRKSDGAVVSAMALDQFWLAAGVASAFTFDTYDPRIVYDPASERFFVVSLNGRWTSNEILVAVSASADPTQGFTGFALDSDSTDRTWADFPTIGVDADTVTIAADMLRVGSEGLPISVDVLVIPKVDLLPPAPTIGNATLFERASVSITGYAPQPVTRLDGAGLPGWLFSSGVAFLGFLPTARIGGSAEAPTLTKGPLLTVEDPTPTPPDASQPGGALLDPGDGHFASLVQRDGAIWGVHCAQGPSGRAAIRWHEFDAATGEVRQSGMIEDPERDFLYPSVAVDGLGDVVIGFSASGATLVPSAFAVLGETVGGATRFGEPISVLPGSASLSGSGLLRFGDYSATVADPSDPTRIWTFQEIGGKGGFSSVAIAALRVVAPEPRADASTATCVLLLAALARGRRRDCDAPDRRRTLLAPR